MTDETLMWNPEQSKSKGISFVAWIMITANILLFIFSGTALLHAYQRDEKVHMNADLRKISAYFNHYASSFLPFFFFCLLGTLLSGMTAPLLDAMEFPMTRKMSFAQYGDG